MQWQAPWIKPAVWGAVIGSIATMIVGFAGMGWVAGGTAERMAMQRANTAVVSALTPACVAKFMQQQDVTVKLEQLRTTDSWKQREFVEAGGWATPTGGKAPNSDVASACAEQLLRARTS
jgi:aminoglycoside phosphotransferase (APT) family kinase protein